MMPANPYGANPPSPKFGGTSSAGIAQFCAFTKNNPLTMTKVTTERLHKVNMLLTSVDSLAPNAKPAVNVPLGIYYYCLKMEFVVTHTGEYKCNGKWKQVNVRRQEGYVHR